MNRNKIILTFSLFLFVASFAKAQIEPPQANTLDGFGVELDGIKGNIKSIHYDEYFAKDYFGEIIRNTGSTIPTKIIFNEKNQITDIEGITNQGIVFVAENEIKNSPLSFIINTSGTFFNLQDSSTGSFSSQQTWKYDNSKNIIEYIEFRNDTIYEKKLAKYDINNKLTEYKEYDSDGEIQLYESFTYDFKGRIIDKIEMFGIRHHHYKYIYNTFGNLIEELKYDKNEELILKYNFLFDNKGNKIAEIETNYDNSKIYTDTTTFTYNVYGKIILEEKLLKWRKYRDWCKRKTYKYDSNNRLLEILKYEINLQEQPVFEYKESYIYNNIGKLLEKQEIKYNSNNKEEWKKIEKFDTDGNSIIEISYDDNNNIKSKTTEKFDNNRNLIEKIDISNDSEKPYKSVDTYEYDSKGNWIKKIEYTIESPKTFPDNYIITERIIEYR